MPKPHAHGSSRWAVFTEAARHDFLQAASFLVIGAAAAAAALNVLVPPWVFEHLAGQVLLGILVMALLAVILAICSEADAFVAASLSMLPLLPRLVFLVVGPAVDVKLVAMHAGLFGPRVRDTVCAAGVRGGHRRRNGGRSRCSRRCPVTRETENALLLLVGISTGMIAVTGAYTRYVKPSLLPWLVATAVLLIVLAGTAIIRDIRHHAGEQGDTDPHGHNTSIIWLLLVPIVVLIFVVPPALNAKAVSGRVVDVSTDVLRRAYPPLPAERAPELSLPEVLVRAARDTAGSLDDRLFTTTGFTLDRTDGDGVDLARIVLICCAADGRLARIHLGGPDAAEIANLPENTWLRVEGKLAPMQQDSSLKSTPTLLVSEVTQIDPPENVYVY